MTASTLPGQPSTRRRASHVASDDLERLAELVARARRGGRRAKPTGASGIDREALRIVVSGAIEQLNERRRRVPVARAAKKLERTAKQALSIARSLRTFAEDPDLCGHLERIRREHLTDVAAAAAATDAVKRERARRQAIKRLGRLGHWSEDDRDARSAIPPQLPRDPRPIELDLRQLGHDVALAAAVLDRAAAAMLDPDAKRTWRPRDGRPTNETAIEAVCLLADGWAALSGKVPGVSRKNSSGTVGPFVEFVGAVFELAGRNSPAGGTIEDWLAIWRDPRVRHTWRDPRKQRQVQFDLIEGLDWEE